MSTRRTITGALACVGLLLTGCAAADPGGTAASTAPAASTAATAAAPATTAAPAAGGAAGTAVAVTADPAWSHVHNLTLDGERLLIGTHEGLWAQDPGRPARQVSEEPFDVMGFALASATMYASGHPGPSQDAPADLGLQASTDGGRTWTAVALEGEVDFHRLRATASVVQGISAHDGRLLRSTDAGTTWTELGTPPLFDLALDPDDPEVLVGTTASGPVRSTDGGRTLTPIPDAPLLAFLAWSGPTLFGIDADGAVHSSTDAGATWQPAGHLDGQPQALAASGEHVVALVGDTIWESADGGTTFTQRITGLATH